MDRRDFLAGSLSAAFVLREASSSTRGSRVPKGGRQPLGFDPVPPSDRDVLSVPNGFRAEVVVSYGDVIGEARGKSGPITLGYNNDFIAFLPIDMLRGGRSSDHGLLFVNHEYNHPLLQHGTFDTRTTSREQVRLEMATVGFSVLEVRRGDDRWQVVPDSQWTRQWTALGPQIEMSGPAAGSDAVHGRREARGSLANCAGGVTPWNTVTTCEENYHYAYGFGDPPFEGPNGWHRHVSGFATDYGWVVEIDPFGELPPRKRTALGRFAHENCAFTTTPDGRLVVYSGDDRVDQCVYKFVSSWKLTGDRRRDWEHALDEGVLYVADFLGCRWCPLNHSDDPAGWRRAGFASQADIVVRARDASRAVGGTPMDRPEGIVVHPESGEVYIAFTKNRPHGNAFGNITWLRAADGDHGAGQFEHGVLAAGGTEGESFACPDNLMLDQRGGLWMASDISGSDALSGAHRRRGNNALFFVETEGEDRGASHRFASAPRDAEFTGPSATPDETTLFLSVQHPGETTSSLDQMTSHWPLGGDARPLPSIVAITREDGKPVLG